MKDKVYICQVNDGLPIIDFSPPPKNFRMETRQCRIEEHGVERNKRHWFKEFKKRIDDDDEKASRANEE